MPRTLVIDDDDHLKTLARTLIRATAATQHEPGRCLEQVNQLLFQHDIPGESTPAALCFIIPAASPKLSILTAISFQMSA